MPKILHIFDVSPFIHAGRVNKASKLEQLVDLGTTWKTQVTPTGGLSLIFNTLYSVIDKGDFVFCCDRNPTIKKDMYPDYKATRHHDTEIQVQKGVVEYVLEKCNCTVLARAGYEADDIIYSIVQKFYKAYDYIYIYTGDSDLYFLVDDIVSIKPHSSRGKEVNRYNYEQVLKSKKSVYNTLTVQKIIKGDSSDNIPALPKDVQGRVAQALYMPEFYPHLGNKAFVKQWVDYLVPEASAQVDLVFPLDIYDLPDDFKKPDKDMIRNFGVSINNKYFRNHTANVDFDIKPYIEEMQSKGYYLEEGD